MSRGGEPVSPELALVDPALAEAARRGLGLPNPNGAERATGLLARQASAPSTDQPNAASTRASPPAGPEREQPAANRIGITEVEQQRGRVSGPSGVAPATRNRPHLGRMLAVCALLGIGVWIGASQLGRGGGSEVGARKPVAPPEPESPVHHANKKHSAAPKAQPRAAATGKGSVRGRVRTFGWIRDPKASFYAIEFSSGGRQILEARTTQPRLVIPASWTYRGRHFRFEPGRYTWIVRPAYRGSGHLRYGAAIVRAKLVLSG